MELIAELQSEAEGAVTAALIVAFDSTTLFLEASDHEPLAMLRQMIEAGGEPVGIMRVTGGDSGESVSFRPLDEYSADNDVRLFLRELSEAAVRHFAAQPQSKE